MTFKSIIKDHSEKMKSMRGQRNIGGEGRGRNNLRHNFRYFTSNRTISTMATIMIKSEARQGLNDSSMDDPSSEEIAVSNLHLYSSHPAEPRPNGVFRLSRVRR